MCQLLLFPIRFIPADAGNSSVISSIAELNAVYPRWRGELHNRHCHTIADRGLSPLARGTLTNNPYQRRECRFIPAGAGNSLFHCKNPRKTPVYPRWRGELCGQKLHVLEVHGLSPLARGTLKPVIRFDGNMRFIPAGAGNSQIEAAKPKEKPVYPRWRGELAKTARIRIINTGLSPLARGTH